MQVTTPLSERLGRYLDLQSDQMKMTASNMANLDTPGYRTQGFDFAAEFGKSLGEADASAVQSSEVEGLVSRPDGNNVAIDREALQMAKTQLEFRTGVELLKREYSRVMTAIHAETR